MCGGTAAPERPDSTSRTCTFETRTSPGLFTVTTKRGLSVPETVVTAPGARRFFSPDGWMYSTLTSAVPTATFAPGHDPPGWLAPPGGLDLLQDAEHARGATSSGFSANCESDTAASLTPCWFSTWRVGSWNESE